MQEYFESEVENKCPYDTFKYIDNIHNVFDEQLKVIRCDLELRETSFVPITFEYCTHSRNFDNWGFNGGQENGYTEKGA